MRRAAAILAVAMAGVASCARHREASAATTGPGSEQTITVDGTTRSYLLYDYSDGRRTAVVIVLHGGGGNGENAVNMTQLHRIAERERFIAVFPNGSGGGRRARDILLTWNAGHCCAAAMQQHVNDVAFMAAVIDRLVASGHADPARIYVTGMSNGAMMSHRLGRELSTKIAAIAPVVGAVFGDEGPPQAPVPAFIIVGAEDQTVPPNGGPLQLRALLGNRSAADHDVAPALAQATYWARANGCRDSTVAQASASRSVTWNQCASGAPVVYHSVAGNGHAWPGGRPGRRGAAEPSQAFNASEAMWAFFKTQRR